METAELKRIANYTGLNFDQVRQLPWGAFLLYRRDSWIDVMKKTEDGRNVLKTVWRLQQTEADETAIHAFQERPTIKSQAKSERK